MPFTIAFARPPPQALRALVSRFSEDQTLHLTIWRKVMKKKVNIERAWKDREYFDSLGPMEKALVPANPIGTIELTEMELEGVAGGTGTGAGCSSCVQTVTGTGTKEGACQCDISC
jgi:mersacidin/lichenicidin family type 2 lantibiotic